MRYAMFVIIVAIDAVANAPQAADTTSAIGSTAARIQYDAAWFTRFAPRTALDMVNQTPGFTLLDNKDTEQRRGYAGAVGNVLVDGARPSAKDQTLSEILQRIPAAQVVRIEILRGVEAGADASGQPVLANVVRTRFSGQGFWSGGFERAVHHSPAPNATMTWTGRIHSADYALGASTYSLRRDLPGERAVTDGTGTLTGRRIDTSPRHYEQYMVNGDVGAEVWGGRLRVTGREGYTHYHHDWAVEDVSSTGVHLDDELNPYTESRRTSEIGANFEHSAGSWHLALVSLLTRSRYESEANSARFSTSPLADFSFGQRLARDSGESILRTTLARSFSGAHRVEFGIEGALNTLDARVKLDLTVGGVPIPQSIRNGNVAVEERRSDAFVAHVWQPNARWSLESRLAGEISHLGFTGDTNQSVHFAFVKPSMQLVRAFGAHQVRLRVVRDVGQLDFTDFVSAASVADNRIEGGNPDLRPETSWLTELAADFRPRPDIVLGLTVFHRRIHDTVDLIPVANEDGTFVDAPGNIGSARAHGVTLGLRTPLPALGRSTFTFDATWSESEVMDPITGRRRQISEFERVKLTAGLRQDLQRVAWGMSYKLTPKITKFRVREIEMKRESPSLDVFTELGLAGSLRVKLAVVSLLGSPGRHDRTLFVTDRTGAIDRIESGRDRPGHWFQLFLSGSF
jgi:outer membrane receptor protein involved in Fe transport